MPMNIVISEDDLHDLIVQSLHHGHSMPKMDIANGVATTLINDAPIKPMVFHKEYDGFESLADLNRDASEAFDESINEGATLLPDGEFDGTVTMILTYSQ